MPRRLPAMVAAGLILLTSACSGGDNGSGAGASADAPAPSTQDTPKFTPFGELPGPELMFYDNPAKPSVRVKPVDATWSADLVGVPADPGFHYLTVYVAVTGELADRGVEQVTLNGLMARYQSTNGMCGKVKLQPDDDQSCFREAYPSSSLAKAADGTWREHQWEKVTVMGTNLKKGETMFGVVGFKIEDNVDTAFKLCAPSKEHRSPVTELPCVPITAPRG